MHVNSLSLTWIPPSKRVRTNVHRSSSHQRVDQYLRALEGGDAEGVFSLEGHTLAFGVKAASFFQADREGATILTASLVHLLVHRVHVLLPVAPIPVPVQS
jgi:hypothetical protein